MKAIIFIKGCDLEEKIEEKMDDYAFDLYDKALDNPLYEKAISFFEKNYPEYCDIVELPKDAIWGVNCGIVKNDYFIKIIMIKENGWEKCIYYYEYE